MNVSKSEKDWDQVFRTSRITNLSTTEWSVKINPLKKNTIYDFFASRELCQNKQFEIDMSV